MDVLQRWIWTNIQVNEGMTGDDVNLNGGSNSLLHSLYNIKRFTKSADHASVGIVFWRDSWNELQLSERLWMKTREKYWLSFFRKMNYQILVRLINAQAVLSVQSNPNSC